MNESDEYQTPLDFFKVLDDEFHFILDPCSFYKQLDDNRLTPYTLNKEINALKSYWYNYLFRINDVINDKNYNIFVNPPYSNTGAWIKKGYEESLKGCNVIFLIHVDTSCSYWHDYIFPFAKQIRYVRGRINFILNGESKNNNRHASVVVIFSNTLNYKQKEIYYNKSIKKFLSPILTDDEIDKIVEGIINE